MTDTLNLDQPFAASDLASMGATLDSVNLSAERLSRTLSRTFASAIVGGKSFDETLKMLATSLTRMALNAGLQPLSQGLMGLFGAGVGSLFGSGVSVAPFADGGVVSRPTFFGSGGGLGLMGERGAEAIMPLARGPDGRLGLAAHGAGSRPVSVTVNISTPDVDSFARSQTQVTSALARAVARGQRGL